MKQRVLEVIPGLEHGNGMIFAKRQVDSLERSGVDVCRFFLSSRTSPLEVFSEFRRFRKVIRDFEPDVIHSQFGTVTALFCALSSLKPLVITFRGSDLNHSPSDGVMRSFLQILFSQLSCLRARQVICVSAALTEKLWFGCGKVHVASNGINLSTFKLISKDKARERLDWDLTEKVVLFNAGRNPDVKRLSLARDAVHVALKNLKNDPLENDNSFRFEVLDGSIHENDIPLYLNAADCLLVTSRHEGSPNIVKEALASNLPIVSVDVGDIRERIQGVFPSQIVEAIPERIAEGLIGCLNENQRSNGRVTIKNELSEEVVAKKIIGILEAAQTPYF